MRVRPAADEDLPEIARIAAANDDEDGANPRYVAHLREHGRFVVAADGGGLAGYCGVRPVGADTMLTDLFADPSRHGSGTGRVLLDAALAGAGDLFTFASRDPRAMSLYVRYGMVPRWPLLYLSGTAGPGGRFGLDLVSPEEAAAAEVSLHGRDRHPDYAFWATFPDATGLLVRDGATVVAAGAAGGGWLFHLVTASGADPAATLAAALGAFGTDRQGSRSRGRVALCLPGPHPALPSLLEARWRIDDLDHHLSSRPDLVSPSSVLSPSLA
jgi:GNAT superfamily N-acetyltransferase